MWKTFHLIHLKEKAKWGVHLVAFLLLLFFSLTTPGRKEGIKAAVCLWLQYVWAREPEDLPMGQSRDLW